MRLSVVVPSLTGEVPSSLLRQVEGLDDVEIVVVRGVRPVGKARNEGLRRATGEYIAWVDSDDEVADDWAEAVLRTLEANPDAVVFGFWFQLSGAYACERTWHGGDLLGDVLRQDILCSELCNKVVRRELWTGVRFDDTARTMEDWEVLPQVLAKVKTVVAIESPLYRYFTHEDSLTHQVGESMQHEVFSRALGRLELIRKLGLWDQYGRIALGGVASAVYSCAEALALSGKARSPTKGEAERWLRRHLPTLLLETPARLTYKVKWMLAAARAWWFVRWYYGRILGRDA